MFGFIVGVIVGAVLYGLFVKSLTVTIERGEKQL